MAATRPSGHFSLPREALEHQNRGPYNLAVSTTLLVLATVFVILRVVARRMKKIWGWEDWFCIAALVGLLVSGTMNYVQISNGLGRHVQFVPVYQQVIVLKCLLAIEIFYNITMVLVKYSFCWMYVRLFPRLRRLVYTVGGFVSAWGIAFTFALIFQCNPMQKFWEQQVPGTCLDPRPIFVANAVLNFLSDMALLCMPISQVIKLEVQTSVKVSVCSIFLLGGFVSFSGLYRITTLLAVDPTDTTWTFVNSNIWTIIELSGAVISATLPTLRPLLKKISAPFCSLTTRASRKGNSTGISAVRTPRAMRPSHNRPASSSTISLAIINQGPMSLERYGSNASRGSAEETLKSAPREQVTESRA